MNRGNTNNPACLTVCCHKHVEWFLSQLFICHKRLHSVCEQSTRRRAQRETNLRRVADRCCRAAPAAGCDSASDADVFTAIISLQYGSYRKTISRDKWSFVSRVRTRAPEGRRTARGGFTHREFHQRFCTVRERRWFLSGSCRRLRRTPTFAEKQKNNFKSRADSTLGALTPKHSAVKTTLTVCKWEDRLT